MAHLKIEMLNARNLKLTCVYTRGPKRTPFISVVENTTLSPHDVEHVIWGLGFDEDEEDATQDLAVELCSYKAIKEELDPEDRFQLKEIQMSMSYYMFVYKHVDMSEYVELLEHPRNCRVTMFENKVKVLYV